MTTTIKKYVFLCVMLLLWAVPAWSTTNYTVSNIDELRAAITSADSGAIITLNASTYDLTSTLSITKSITLKGNTSSGTIIQRSSSASSKFSNITISGASADMVILQNLTIANASTDDNGGGINYKANGTLSIDNCIITNNMSSNYSGGIYNSSGTANITNSTITGNTTQYGGGIYVNGGTANIINCTISGNSASINGGGIYGSGGTANITNSTITGNTANQGGREIHNNRATLSALNTLIWNSSNATAGNLTLTNCATFNGSGTNLVILSSWANPVSSSVEVDGVTHTVFIPESNDALLVLVGKGVKTSSTPATDQLGKARAKRPTIGAIEGVSVSVITVSCDVDTVQVTEGYSADIAVSADLADDYKACTISWDISPDVSGITFSDGVLRVGVNVPVGSYNVELLQA